MSLLGTVLTLLMCTVAQSAIEKDRVTKVPGLAGNLPFTMYSGHLTVNNTYKVHYEFHVTPSNPMDSPLLVWQQGGPGGSSVMGSLIEMGPFHFNSSSTLNMKDGVPHVYTNQWSWHGFTNMLYFDHPPGVRYSYCVLPGTNTATKCQKWNDYTQADVFYMAVEEFYRNYKEYLGSKNDLYLAGESYAGLYLPAISYHWSKQQTPFKALNGLAVGNGCINVPGATQQKPGNCNGPHSTQISVDVLYWDALIDTQMHKKVYQACGIPRYNDWQFAQSDETCQEALDAAWLSAQAFNPYFVDDNCPLDLPELRKKNLLLGGFDPIPQSRRARDGFISYDIALEDASSLPRGGTYYGCNAFSAGLTWLTSKPVQDALHLSGTYQLSNFDYDCCGFSSVDHWPEIAKRYRALIYNGADDSVCPWPQNEEWTTGMKWPVKDAWKHWYGSNGDVHNLTAGYRTIYNIPGASHTLTFLTIRDSGHMVPEYQPRHAYEMMSRFIKDIPL